MLPIKVPKKDDVEVESLETSEQMTNWNGLKETTHV